jgi:hypothetical protein
MTIEWEHQIAAHNAGWRSQFRLASQARHQMGAPNGLFASRIVVADHGLAPGGCEFFR